MSSLFRFLGWLRRAAGAPLGADVGPIVFLGDSITLAWRDADPSFFRGNRLNRGIGGETTAQMLERFEDDVVSRRPSAVHIMAGTNDLWHGAPGPEASASLANLAEMVEIARANGIRVIVALPPPIAPAAAHHFRYPELFPTLRSSIGAYCRTAGIQLVDYAQSLTDANGVLRAALTTDGVHLSKAGYRAIRSQAERAIAARGRQKRSDRWAGALDAP